MDMNKIKLVYSQKYNQFYKPMRIDVDVGVVYIIPTNNRHDKTIRKDEILRIEENSDYRFVVMHDDNTTAEQNFMDALNSNNPHKKMSVIKDFKKNMLDESEQCLSKLKELSEMFILDENEDDVKIRNLASIRYRSLDVWRDSIVENNRKSYENQDIPKETMKLALAKRLFIERRDEYCFKAANTYERKLAPKVARMSIQSNFPCGFLIKDRGGYVIAGKNGNRMYTLSLPEVIDFVEKYVPTAREKHYHFLYQVPMSKRKERQLANCYNILKEHGLHYKNEHNYFFWVLDKKKNVIAGGKNGFGFKWLLKYCRRLQSQPKKKNKSVTDK